jgi:hypothetical protein
MSDFEAAVNAILSVLGGCLIIGVVALAVKAGEVVGDWFDRTWPS